MNGRTLFSHDHLNQIQVCFIKQKLIRENDCCECKDSGVLFYSLKEQMRICI